MKIKSLISPLILTLIVSGSLYYFMLPAFNLTDPKLTIWLVVTIGLFSYGHYVSRRLDDKTVNSQPYMITGGLLLILTLITIVIGPFFASSIFHAKSYSDIISVKDKNFKDNFPETEINHLALLDRKSAEKIGNSYLGQIDKVSQFEVSDEYRQITIKDEPYRVSPLQYASLVRWFNNRNDGIPYYVKVNQTTGKAELVKLKKGMKYTASSYFNDDLFRKLRFVYPTELFSDPSFEVDDEGNPWYIATTYKRKFMFGVKDPNGVILFDPITGKSKKYDLKHVPKWVDRVYGADDTIQKIDWHYSLHKGFWNTVFSKNDIKKTTDEYNYISIGSDIYLYSGLTSINSDSSNLGFVLTNMRTRETTFYKLASTTERNAMRSAEGAVQDKRYDATSPILTKLNSQSYYLVSLKDNGNLIKAYALVNAEDFQQVKVAENINDLLQAVNVQTIKDTDQPKESSKNEIKGKIATVKTQVVDGTTIYYLKLEDGKIYKIKASAKTLDVLPFIEIGQTISGFVDTDNFLSNVTIE